MLGDILVGTIQGGRRRAAEISCGYGEEKTVGWVAVAVGQMHHRPRMVGQSSVPASFQPSRLPSSPSLLHVGSLHLGSEGTGQ
jgi:hypothetical protein